MTTETTTFPPEGGPPVPVVLPGRLVEVCRWCCSRCRTSAQPRFIQRLLAVGTQPREYQCWRCTTRLTRSPATRSRFFQEYH